MKPFLILAAVLVMLRLMRALLVLNQLLRRRLWRTRVRLAAEQEVPLHVHEGLRAPVAELEALGFEPLGWMALACERPGGEAPRFSARLFHRAMGAYVTVGFSSMPDPGSPWSVTFSSPGADGRLVTTFGGGEQSTLGEPSGTISVAPYAPTLPLQWQAHCAAARTANIVPPAVDHDAFFAASRDRQEAHFDSLVQSRQLLSAESSAYAYSWPLALRVTRSALSASKRLKAQRAERERHQRASLQPPPTIPVEEEIAAYERYVESTSGRPRASFLVALFAVTVPLFVVAGSYSLGAATTAATVLGIVLFHEAGHYLAMRGFGYVDTTIFFVPFLGGIATGRKDGATLGQRMIVLLAGPLPGLLIALSLGLARAPLPHWLHEPLLLLAVINLFNLLPILPLDGGQIAHMLLFARRPWLDVASRAVAGVSLVLIGWQASGVFLAVLGGLTLVQLPMSRRHAEVRRQFREARVAWPAEPAERLLFRVLRTTPLASSPFAQKIAVARTTLTQAGLDAPVRAGAMVGWFTAYGSVFAVGCVAAVLSLGTQAVAGASQREPPHVVDVAPLRCPAPARSDPEASAGPTETLPAGTGVFDTPEAAVAATARLNIAVPGAVVRTLGPALLVWAPMAGDDDDDLAPTPSIARAQRVAAALGAAGGRYYDWRSSPVVECTATDVASAQATEDGLETYMLAARSSIDLGAPWDGDDKPTDDQKVARRTFQLAMAASENVRLDLGSSHWWSLFSGKHRNFMAEYRAQHVRAVEAALAAARASQPIDEDVARLVVAKIGAPSDRERLDDELGARLGWSSRRRRPGGDFLTKVSHGGSRLRVELAHLRPSQVDAGVRPMLAWLCAQSCVDEHLLLETR